VGAGTMIQLPPFGVAITPSGCLAFSI
jgi:hypothetical protein